MMRSTSDGVLEIDGCISTVPRCGVQKRETEQVFGESIQAHVNLVIRLMYVFWNGEVRCAVYMSGKQNDYWCVCTPWSMYHARQTPHNADKPQGGHGKETSIPCLGASLQRNNTSRFDFLNVSNILFSRRGRGQSHSTVCTSPR